MSRRRDEAADEVVQVEPAGDSGGGGIGAALIGPLLGAPRNINGALSDLRTIADQMRYLPEMARSLGRIEKRVNSLDDEVKQMRQAVESMGGSVETLGGGIDTLGENLGDVRLAVDSLEPHLVEMRASLRPLKRAMGRLGRPTA